MTGIDDKLTLYDEEGKYIWLELFHFPHSTLKIKPVEITRKGSDNFRVKIENCFIHKNETQNFKIDYNEINFQGECGKLRPTIEKCIEKSQILILKFNSPNKTYFSKKYSNNQAINTLVIPTNSLQEDFTTQNPNNSSPSSDKYFYFLVIGIIIFVSLFVIFLLIKLIKRPKRQNP